MSLYFTNDSELTSIADAIRAKGGTTSSLSYPIEYVNAIEAIEPGGILAKVMNKDINILKTSKLRQVFSYAFYSYDQIREVNLPMCSYIGDYAFYMNSSLTSINLPVCSRVETYTFNRCYSLMEAYLPVCEYIGDYAFYMNNSLTSINLPACGHIGNYAFYGCDSLKAIYLGTSEVVTIENQLDDIFGSTPIIGYNGDGSIYVPASLLTDYKAAEHWSVYSSRIFAM